MSKTVCKRLYEDVAANSVETIDYVVPNGKVLHVKHFEGSGSAAPDTSIQFVWDYGGTEEIKWLTHGDNTHTAFDVALTGNGTKKFTIVLTNDQDVSDLLGGFWYGKEVDA